MKMPFRDMRWDLPVFGEPCYTECRFSTYGNMRWSAEEEHMLTFNHFNFNVADNSFGIYIFHAVFLNAIDHETHMPGVPAWFGIVLFVAVIFLLSDLSVTLYKRAVRAVLPSRSR